MTHNNLIVIFQDSGNQYACDFDGDDSYLSEMTQTDLKEKHDMVSKVHTSFLKHFSYN